MAIDTNTLAINVVRPAATQRSIGWLVKRAVAAVAFLVGFAVGGAWLLYASIDASADEAGYARSLD